jgi:hypothetical protein
MTSLAIIVFLIVAGTVWGGFFIMLGIAIKSEKKNQ